MKCSFSLLLLISLLTAIGQSPVLGNSEIIGRQQLDYFFDFEDESAGIDQSQGSVKWKIEDYDSPWEPKFPAPEPQSGKKYIRVDRGSTKTFGVAVLSFQDIVINNTESFNVTFSYWIHSKWPEFNKLQLYIAENGRETLLKEFSQSYDNENKWQDETSEYQLSQTSPNISLVFYAFCGTNVDDAIAIDDIYVILSSNDNSATSTELSTTSEETDTPTDPTTTNDGTTTIESTTSKETLRSTQMTPVTPPLVPCIPTSSYDCSTTSTGGTTTLTETTTTESETLKNLTTTADKLGILELPKYFKLSIH